VIEPLRISVPTAGVHYAFEKLYANQSDQDAWIALPYASGTGSFLGKAVSALGALMLWLGVGLLVVRDPRVPPPLPLGLAAAGLLIVVAALGVSHVSAMPAVLVSFVFVLAAGGLHARRLVQQRAAPSQEKER
jgi:hypothetical protein